MDITQTKTGIEQRSDNTNIRKPKIKEPVEQSVNGVKWSDLDFKTQMMNRRSKVNGRPQEEGLEIVSPEFDMISGIRGLTNIKIPNLGNPKIINKLEPGNKKTIEYVANKNSSKTYIGLLERPNKNISLQESLGVPKQLRNLKIKNNPNSGINSNVHTNLINRNKSIYDFSTGDLIWKNKYNNNQIRATYHFTTDQPVLSHSFANWDDASETLIFPYKNAVRQAGNPISTEPMDTFFASPNNFKINRDGVRILTGNKKNYLKYKGWKVDAEYSKESDDILNTLKDKKIKRQDILQTIKSKNLNRKEIDDLNLEIKKLDNDIDDLMNKNRDIHSNWVNKNNQISLKDYDDIYAETNIPNSIKPKTEYSEKTIKNKELEYWTQPTTHSDSWLGAAESNIKAGINQFLKKAKRGEPIRKEELTMFQYYFNRLNNKTNFRLDNSSYNNKIINRILSGEKIFKYQSGGSLKSQLFALTNRSPDGRPLEQGLKNVYPEMALAGFVRAGIMRALPSFKNSAASTVAGITSREIKDKLTKGLEQATNTGETINDAVRNTAKTIVTKTSKEVVKRLPTQLKKPAMKTINRGWDIATSYYGINGQIGAINDIKNK